MRHNEIQKKLQEGGLADLASRAEQDHEVQMARSDLYKLAKYSIKLHEMLKMIPETRGLEGWQQAKITKAADYISSVYHNLDYEMKFEQQQVAEKKKSSYKDGLSAMLESKKKISERSVSKAQQKLMGQAYAYKKGELDDASDAVKELANSMSLKDLKDFASTEHKGLPDKVGETTTKEGIAQAKRNVGVDDEPGNPCWSGKKLGNPKTKKKNGKEVPNCVDA